MSLPALNYEELDESCWQFGRVGVFGSAETFSGRVGMLGGIESFSGYVETLDALELFPDMIEMHSDEAPSIVKSTSEVLGAGGVLDITETRNETADETADETRSKTQDEDETASETAGETASETEDEMQNVARSKTQDACEVADEPLAGCHPKWWLTYTEVLTYLKEQGRLPGSDEHPRLWGWLQRQRRRSKKMPTHRALLLALPGWCASPFQDRWWAMYSKLVAYVRVYDRTPFSCHVRFGGVCLGRWVSEQTKRYGALGASERTALEKMPDWHWRHT